MPRDPSYIPAYRQHKADGRAVVTLNGRTHYLGKHDTPESRERYRRIIADWLANGRRLPQPVQDGAPLTVADLILRYKAHAETYYVKHGEPTSELHCIRMALRHLRLLYSTLPVAQFGPHELKAVRASMTDPEFRGRLMAEESAEIKRTRGNPAHRRIRKLDLARGVVNGMVARIVRAFRWGVAEGLVPPDVLAGLAAVSGLRKGRSSARETEPVPPVPDAHVDAIEQHVSPQVWAMVELQRLTGMRPGEVRSMRACDVDTTGDLWEYRPADHKNAHRGSSRIVPLGPRARDVLRPFLECGDQAVVDLQRYLFSPREAEAARSRKRRASRQSPLTPSQRQRRCTRQFSGCYSKDTYIGAIRRACEKAGVPVWTPNQLRHTAGTQIRKRFGLDAAQVLLGHATADTTQIYAAADLERARTIMSEVG